MISKIILKHMYINEENEPGNCQTLQLIRTESLPDDNIYNKETAAAKKQLLFLYYMIKNTV